MIKRRLINYDQRIIEALKKLPNSIYDARHNFTIYFINNKARSNQDRFEHISRNFHELTVKDIESIPEGLVARAKLKQEKGRKDTYNYYFVRKRDKTHFVKISVKVIDWVNRIAVVKTIFITGSIK